MTAFWLIGVLAALSKPLALREEASDAASPLWLEISERTTCEAMQDDYCLGRYGFTIRHDGKFLVPVCASLAAYLYFFGRDSGGTSPAKR